MTPRQSASNPTSIGNQLTRSRLPSELLEQKPPSKHPGVDLNSVPG